MSDKALAVLHAILTSIWELCLAGGAAYEVYKWQNSKDAGCAVFVLLMFWLYAGRESK